MVALSDFNSSKLSTLSLTVSINEKLGATVPSQSYWTPLKA